MNIYVESKKKVGYLGSQVNWVVDLKANKTITHKNPSLSPRATDSFVKNVHLIEIKYSKCARARLQLGGIREKEIESGLNWLSTIVTHKKKTTYSTH